MAKHLLIIGIQLSLSYSMNFFKIIIIIIIIIILILLRSFLSVESDDIIEEEHNKY